MRELLCPKAQLLIQVADLRLEAHLGVLRQHLRLHGYRPRALSDALLKQLKVVRHALCNLSNHLPRERLELFSGEVLLDV